MFLLDNYYRQPGPARNHAAARRPLHRLPAAVLLSLSFCLAPNLVPATTVILDDDVATKFVGPKNYYSNDRLRSQVERYHIGPGIKKMQAGEYQYALNDFRFVLRHYPNHPRALNLIGELALRMKNPNLAEEYFQKAIALYPDTATTYAAYGVFNHKQKKLDKAIENYRKALELNPALVEIRYNLGLALTEQGRMKEALEEAKKVYSVGYPLQGLKERLVRAGVWQTP